MATLEQFYDTIEPLDLVQEAFPKMVSSFLESRDTAKSKGKKLMKPTELKCKFSLISLITLIIYLCFIFSADLRQEGRSQCFAQIVRSQ